MTDVFEKNEKKNKATSVYRLAYMIYSLCNTIGLNGQLTRGQCGKIEFRVWISVIPGIIPIALKSHKEQFRMIVGVHFVTISPLPPFALQSPNIQC